jgi:putative Holliday junction resolvase
VRILGIDFGERRIGLAISDEEGKIAFGFGVIDTKKEDVFKRLMEVVCSKNIEEIVIGLPTNMNGTIGKRAEKVASFAKDIASSLGVKVRLWDERLTTTPAERILIEADLSRKKRKAVIDELSATIILQNYLDYLSRKT